MPHEKIKSGQRLVVKNQSQWFRLRRRPFYDLRKELGSEILSSIRELPTLSEDDELRLQGVLTQVY